MKKTTLLLTFGILLLTLIVNAQNLPNAFNYSAVARDASNQILANTTLGIQITILKSSPSGVSQYVENHSIKTDAFGLFNLVIGAGAVQSGSMESVVWYSDTYYLKIGMDATGGTNFLTVGTTQLLSVPYSMHAKTADSVLFGGGTGGKHFIGEQFGGGVIFHLWKDSTGTEHGLIVDKSDLSNSVWSNNDQTWVGLQAQSSWNGLKNSNGIVGQSGHTNSAAALCLNSNRGGQSDWYLPSMHELNLLWNNYFTVARTLSQISGATELEPDYYWSSTEDKVNLLSAWVFNFFHGETINYTKGYLGYVRAIRAF